MSFSDLIGKLSKSLDPPAVPGNAFELILWENVAYLVDDEVRRGCFDALEAHVGLTPAAIGAASLDAIALAIEPGGMRPAERATKILRCAELAAEIGLPTLERAIRDDEPLARRLLKRFPGIGDPGADRILLLVGSAHTLAPESNGLRVLCRLGLVREQKSYGATYREAGIALASRLPANVKSRRRAHLLLREHGKRVCRRSAPLCGACPITRDCAFYRDTA